MSDTTENCFVIDADLTEKQTLASMTLARDDIKEVLYGGAKGGGKSVFGCLWCFEKAVEIIELCGIAERKHPIPIGFMGRKRGIDFTNTTLETWKRFIPEELALFQITCLAKSSQIKLEFVSALPFLTVQRLQVF